MWPDSHTGGDLERWDKEKHEQCNQSSLTPCIFWDPLTYLWAASKLIAMKAMNADILAEFDSRKYAKTLQIIDISRINIAFFEDLRINLTTIWCSQCTLDEIFIIFQKNLLASVKNIKKEIQMPALAIKLGLRNIDLLNSLWERLFN